MLFNCVEHNLSTNSKLHTYDDTKDCQAVSHYGVSVLVINIPLV